MTDITRYADVSLKRDTYNKLKDLTAVNQTPVSKSGMITHLVDKAWEQKLLPQKQPSLFTRLFSRSSSEGKSNDS